MNRIHSAEALRCAVEALVTGSGRISERLQAAERYFRDVRRDEIRGPAARDLELRIGAGLVEGGDDEDDVTTAIGKLEESRAAEIAKDILCLYATMLRSDMEPGEQDDPVGSDRIKGKAAELADRYQAAVMRDLEPMIREAGETLEVDGAMMQRLQAFLMRAWMAGAKAAANDEAVAKAARLAQSVEGVIARRKADVET